MKTRLEDYCRSLSVDEISKLIRTLDDIKREKKRDEMNGLLEEFEALIDKIEEKGYTIYYNGGVAHFDYIEICE